jgi:hypothetical protein
MRVSLPVPGGTLYLNEEAGYRWFTYEGRLSKEAALELARATPASSFTFNGLSMGEFVERLEMET